MGDKRWELGGESLVVGGERWVVGDGSLGMGDRSKRWELAKGGEWQEEGGWGLETEGERWAMGDVGKKKWRWLGGALF